jgi:hypothetical protein
VAQQDQLSHSHNHRSQPLAATPALQTPGPPADSRFSFMITKPFILKKEKSPITA